MTSSYVNAAYDKPFVYGNYPLYCSHLHLTNSCYRYYIKQITDPYIYYDYGVFDLFFIASILTHKHSR